MKSTYIVVCTTFDSAEEAKAMIERLLRRRLVSCCQLTHIESSYRWQGEIVHSPEFLVQMKSRRSLYAAIEACIREHHSYEVPEIVAYDITQGSSAYLQWIDRETVGEEDEAISV